jgi:hypothetical protein
MLQQPGTQYTMYALTSSATFFPDHQEKMSFNGYDYGAVGVYDGILYILFWKTNILPNIPFRNQTTGINYTQGNNQLFYVKNNFDFIYLIINNSKVVIYKEDGFAMTLIDTVNMAFNNSRVTFGRALEYFVINNPLVDNNSYLYLYCPIGNCNSCSQPSVCGQCASKYFGNGSSQCVACNSTCSACTSASDCTSCVNGYILNNQTCIRCSITGCILCSASMNCSACQ